MVDDLLRLQDEPSRKKMKIHTGSATTRLNSATLASEEEEEDLSEDGLGHQIDISFEERDDDDDEVSAEEHFNEDIGGDDDDGSSDSESLGSVVPTIDRFASTSRKEKKAFQIHPKKSASSFHELGISAVLQSALASMSIKQPTEVQSACVPPILTGGCVPNKARRFLAHHFYQGRIVLATLKPALVKRLRSPCLSCKSCLLIPTASLLLC